MVLSNADGSSPSFMMNEAAYFADQIVLMRDGRVLQSGAPEELQTRPADPFVTEFIRVQRGWPSRLQ